MIIGFDAKRIVSNGTGLGSYGRTLINDLAENDALSLRLYAPNSGRTNLREQIIERPNITFCYPGEGLTGLRAAIWRSRGITNDLKRDGVQLYHGLSGELPINISKSGIKSIVTIHDLIFLRHPEFYNWIDVKIYAWKFRQTIREASHIVAISECTKRDIIELGGVDERRISLVYQSCSPKFQRSASADRSGLPARYILSVGTIERRKNILLAVKALPYLPEDLSLVIIGRQTPYADEVKAYAKKHGLGHRVIMLHAVSNPELVPYYANAEAFVYPSIYEGFGIPIIEAISSGLPVVACTGSCLEEAGGPDSLYVAPDDAEGMAHAIMATLHGAEGREQRIERSMQYIKRFQGNSVASQMADIYRNLI